MGSAFSVCSIVDFSGSVKGCAPDNVQQVPFLQSYFMLYWLCRIQAAKVLSVSTGGHAPSGSAPEGPKILLLPLTRKAERGDAS